jgi:hexokinase
MLKDVDLTRDQLVEIALAFADRVAEGLMADERQLRCLPAFIPVCQGYRDGRVRVLDLGGSNLRAGLVEVRRGLPVLHQRTETVAMPWQRHRPFDRERFLAVQAEQLGRLDDRSKLPLGYCFSYPTRALPDGDAVLVQWTKGIEVPGTVGQPVGAMLREYLNRDPDGPGCGEVTVINDTVACLVAGLTAAPADVRIGLIVGTGFNLACFFSLEQVAKLKHQPFPACPVPINLEAGNFDPAGLTDWDRIVDEQSENPGVQRMEKAVSGAYLGRLFHAIHKEAGIDPDEGALALVRLLEDPGHHSPQVQETARCLYRRSAWLVASALAGLIKAISNGGGRFSSVGITTEGGLFWGQLQGRHVYAETVEQTLGGLLSAVGLPSVQVHFNRLDDTNLIGAALAALSR